VNRNGPSCGLADSFGRPITYLRLSVVDRCNLRCFYCMPEEGVQKRHRRDLLRLEEYVEVARAARDLGIHKIRITGGEPLVRRGVVRIIRRVCALDGVRTVAMTTNGTRLAKYASVLKEAGLARVNVSLDSLRPETYERITRGGRLASALEGIDAALAVGLPVKINVVLLAGINDGEVVDFADYGRRQGVEIRFIEQMSLGAEGPYVSEKCVLEALERVHRMTPLGGERQDAHIRRYRWDEAVIGFISPRSGSFCSGCNKLRLTTAGELRACLASSAHVALLPILRRPHTEEELRRAIVEAALLKPAEGPWTAPLKMWQIGG